jgi:hypothetical protein
MARRALRAGSEGASKWLGRCARQAADLDASRDHTDLIFPFPCAWAERQWAVASETLRATNNNPMWLGASAVVAPMFAADHGVVASVASAARCSYRSRTRSSPPGSGRILKGSS